MNETYLLLGSNEGDRIAWLQEAVKAISKNIGTIKKQSALYQTAAWGVEDQPDFLNMAILVATELNPVALLEEIHKIETLLGRQRTVKWGQRTLDIDILLFNDDIINLPDLAIPHPRLAERRFVLVPLNEIAAQKTHPLNGKTIAVLLEECPDKLDVKRYGPLP